MKLGPYGMAPSSYEMSQCVAKASCLVGVGVGIVGILTSGRGVRDCEDACAFFRDLRDLRTVSVWVNTYFSRLKKGRCV
jgi:hypothetical protein